MTTFSSRTPSELLKAAAENPDAEVIYTDRDAVDAHSIPTSVFRQAGLVPRDASAATCTSRTSRACAPHAVRAVGGFRSAFDGAQDHDLVLRITERGAPVVHVPRVATTGVSRQVHGPGPRRQAVRGRAAGCWLSRSIWTGAGSRGLRITPPTRASTSSTGPATASRAS